MISYRKILVALLILTFVSIVFSDTTTHCWRQDIARGVEYNQAHTGLICGSGCGEYDMIFSPGGSFSINSISSYNYSCDDAAGSTAKNFVALWEGSRILTTNNDGSGPTNAGGNFCMKGNNICYTVGSTFIPSRGSCSNGSLYVGSGSDSLSYTFRDTDVGEKTISLYVGAISPAVSNPYDGSISYRHLRTYKIFVGVPSLLVFGKGTKQLINTTNNTSPFTEEVVFTLMNKSVLTNKILDYEIDCGNDPNIECEIDDSYKAPGRTPWPIEPGAALFIRGTIIVEDPSKIPTTFPVNLNVTYKVDQITNCPGTGDASQTVNCVTGSYPTIYQVGLVDQQDFQIEMKGSDDQTSCVGPNGLMGQTGAAFAPKVHIQFGGGIGADGKLIQIDECDARRIIDSDEDGIFDSFNTEKEDYVYCSQKEFLIELAAKIERIAEIKEDIAELNIFETSQEYVDKLRVEEANLRTFDAYIREQTFTESSIRTAVNGISDEIVFANIGLGDKFPQVSLISRLESLLVDGVNFSVERADPGLYTVTIDLNDLVDEGLIEAGGTGDRELLFPNGSINQNLQITVTLNKKDEPNFDWFFYRNGESDISDEFVNMVTNTNPFITNIRERGIVLEYSESGADQNKMYVTYAVPVFVKVKGNSSGDSNVLFNISGDVQSGFGATDVGTFTQWSGFASNLGEGCSSTRYDDGSEPLPFRIPDVKLDVPINPDGIDFSIDEYEKVSPNSEMFLETVLYLPIKSDFLTGQLARIKWIDPSLLYTKNGVCASPCNIDVSLSGYKLTRPTSESSLLQVVFDKIAEEEICVFNEITPGSSKWIMFWNQQKILEDLETAKTAAIASSQSAGVNVKECGLTTRVS